MPASTTKAALSSARTATANTNANATAPTNASILCLIRDASTGNRISLRVRPADTVHSLYEAVRLNMDKEVIQLLLAPPAPKAAAPVAYAEDVSASVHEFVVWCLL